MNENNLKQHDEAHTQQPVLVQDSGHYSSAVAQFIDAIEKVESERNPDALLPVFSENAELWRQSSSTTYKGEEGAKQFWTEYLTPFSAAKSTFIRVQEGTDLAVLEWETIGQLHNGDPFRYVGVSILNFDEHDKVETFKTYYDSSALLAPAMEATH